MNLILIKHPQVNLILILSFVCGFFTASFNAIRMPTICRDLYHIGDQYIGLFYNLEAIAFGLTMLIMNKLKDDDCEVYFITFGMCFMIMAIQLMSISVLVYRFKILGISLLVLFTLCTGVGWSAENVFLIALLGKMVPHEVQGYASGARRTAVNFSYIFGSTITPILYGYILEHIFVTSLFFFGLLVIFLYRREKFNARHT